MKKIFLFLLFALVCTGLSGQTEKGRVMLNLHNFSPLLSEGDLLAPTNSFGIAVGSIKQDDEDDIKYSIVGVEGSMHYFLFDNFSAGLNLGIFTQSMKVDDDSESITMLMAGPEIRYYFPLGAKSKLYLRGGAGFGNLKYDDSDTKSTFTEFGGGAGFALFPSDNFSINMGAGYGSAVTKSEFDFLGQNLENKTTNSGLTIDLGFSIFFGG